MGTTATVQTARRPCATMLTPVESLGGSGDRAESQAQSQDRSRSRARKYGQTSACIRVDVREHTGQRLASGPWMLSLPAGLSRIRRPGPRRLRQVHRLRRLHPGLPLGRRPKPQPTHTGLPLRLRDGRPLRTTAAGDHHQKHVLRTSSREGWTAHPHRLLPHPNAILRRPQRPRHRSIATGPHPRIVPAACRGRDQPVDLLPEVASAWA